VQCVRFDRYAEWREDAYDVLFNVDRVLRKAGHYSRADEFMKRANA
jgi:hypothetical protein